MLRITVQDGPPVVTLQLEGRLAGPWVQVLQDCWHNVNARNGVRVDLRGVTSMDVAGRSCLAELHRQGAQFRADGMTEAVVAEIIESAANIA